MHNIVLLQQTKVTMDLSQMGGITTHALYGYPDMV